VDELQQQVYALEAAVSQRNASAGSVAWVQSSRHSAAAQLRNYQQHPLKPHARSRTLTGGTPQRAKTVPSRWRERMAAMLLPHLNEQSLPAIFMQLQEQGLVQK
ncbi:hypothetical protein N308_08588, partial [Struthio camelus australis]